MIPRFPENLITPDLQDTRTPGPHLEKCLVVAARLRDKECA
jgi:hypothetical protein